MKKTLQIVKSTVLLLGVLALTVPLLTWAATEVELQKEGLAYVEKHLPPGQRAEGYRAKLEASGSHVVTEATYNNPAYVDYELVKETHAWEVQLNVDQAVRKATKVNIGNKVGMAEATKQARPDEDRLIFKDPPEDSNRYSDQNRARTERVVAELEALPVGRDKPFYREALQKRGYEVTAINADSREVLNLEAVKNGQSVRFTVDFNDKTGKSTKVGASKLRWEAEATRAARIRIH